MIRRSGGQCELIFVQNIDEEMKAQVGRRIAPSESVTESVTHGKVWHFDTSRPAKDGTNSQFDSNLP